MCIRDSTKYHQIPNLSLDFDGFPLDFDGFLKNLMIFREVEKIKITKKLRKNQNFQKTFFFAINDLMNLAGVQHQY